MKTSEKESKERLITVPEVKKILETIGEESLDQFQRRSLDFASKFSKLDAKTAKELVKKLTSNLALEESEAVEIVNCMPESIEEIRTFLAGGRKIIETSKLEAILTLLNEYRKKKA